MTLREYQDDWAEFYDAEHEAVEGDKELYIEMALEADGPVLDVGCGTGRIYLELLRRDVDACGIDVSRGMLDTLERKAREEGLHPNVEQGDMIDYTTDTEFALVIIPLRTFLHVLTTEDQRRALENLRSMLADDGKLVVDLFVPRYDFICEHYGTKRERIIERNGEQFELVSLTDFEDPVEQVVLEKRELYDTDGRQLYEGEFRMVLISKREFNLLLETTGFSDWTVYGGFDRSELEPTDREMVWVIEK